MGESERTSVSCPKTSACAYVESQVGADATHSREYDAQGDGDPHPVPPTRQQDLDRGALTSGKVI